MKVRVIGVAMVGVAMVGVAMVGVAVTLSGCFLVSPVVRFGGGKSSQQVQHEELDSLLPAPLAAPDRWSGEVRVARLRVWADDEYRAQNVRWQHGFEDQLDDANQVLAPMLGVRLEAEYRSWDHHAPGVPLADQLQALAGEDPGDDVAWVVGLTSSLSLVAGTFEQIGVAHLGGRHLVVRGHADLEERKAFERAFPAIARERRELVLEARRRHKTTALLIHELAHTLGALHETGPDQIMSASYSHHAATISPRNRELMRITLEDRLKPAAERDPRAVARKLLAALDVAWGGWDDGDRAELIAGLRGQAGPQPAGATGPLPATMLEQVQRAEQLLATGDHQGAAAVLAPLLAAYPAHVHLQVLGCRLELLRRGPRDPKASAACDRAAALSADAGLAIEIAGLRRAAGDAAGARATLTAAEARIAGLPPDRAAAAWLQLAGQYRELNAVTWAEDALAHAGAGASDGGISAWAQATRVRYGIPRDGARYKLTPEDDAAALAAVRDVLAKVNTDAFDAAARAAGAAEKRWPALPGVLAARCDLELRRGAIAVARQLCARAIAQGGSSWALYLSGVIELRGGSQAQAATGVARLRSAIDLDPDLAQAWHTLGKVLRRAGAIPELQQLLHDYKARFGAPLPQ
jgi:hypothetical protein